MKYLLRIVLCVLFLNCTNVHHIGLTPHTAEIKAINAKLKNKSVLIKLKTGETVKGKNLKLSPAQISYQFSKSDSIVISEFAAIKRITWMNHRRGAKEGLKYGFLSGVSLGAAIIAINKIIGYGTMGSQPEASIRITLIPGFYFSLLCFSVGWINGAEERVIISSE
ncbi:MAG: hypothetical protein DWQ10_12620 [Calditrichaeota bacterium]|nr:MAG: hypothetical protein DWQ10_12620 [Calditrichota bacterium]